MGFRLPLDSLPWVTSSEHPWDYEPDPLDERGPLPARLARDRQAYLRAALPEDYRNRPGSAEGTVLSVRAPQQGESLPGSSGLP